MIPKLFEHDEFLIDEKVQMLKFENEYKIFSNTGEQVGMVKQKLPGWQKMLQLLINKAMMPFNFFIQDPDGRNIVTITRGWTLFMSKITIADAAGNPIGTIKQKFKLLKPTFIISDNNEAAVATISGDWKAWNFTIKDNTGAEIGLINKKWAGALKEMFTTADKYYVKLNSSYPEAESKVLILSAAITIDMVLKEAK